MQVVRQTVDPVRHTVVCYRDSQNWPRHCNPFTLTQMNDPLLSPLSRDQTRVTLNQTYPGWHWDGGWPPPTSGCNQLGYFPLQWTHPATAWSISGWHAQTLTVRVSDCTAVTQQWTRRDARLTDLFKTRSLHFIPDGIIGIFHWRNPSEPHCGPGVDSASNRIEYQGYLLGGKCGRCVELVTLPHSRVDYLEILGVSNS